MKTSPATDTPSSPSADLAVPGPGGAYEAALAAGRFDSRDGLDLAVGEPGYGPHGAEGAGRVHIYDLDGFRHLHAWIGGAPHEALGMFLLARRDREEADPRRSEILATRQVEDPVSGPAPDEVAILGFLPCLTSSTGSVSASSSSLVILTVDFPAEVAMNLYSVLLSGTGTGPTTVSGGLQVPLTMDHLFLRTWFGDYRMIPWRSGLSGRLDAAGGAVASLGFDPGDLAAVVGRTFYAAAVAFDTAGVAELTSVAVPVSVEP